MRVRDIAVIAVVVALAALAGIVGAPVALAAPLGIASLGATAWLLAALATGSGPRRWIVAISGVFATLMVLGFALNWLPGGLTRSNWSVAWGCFAGAVLAVATRRRVAVAIARPRIVHAPQLASIAAGLVLLITAVNVAHREADADLRPPSAVAIERVSVDDVTLSLTAANSTGPVHLVATQRAGAPTPLWSTTRLAAGTTTRVTLPFPTARTTIAVDGIDSDGQPLVVVLDPTALQKRLGIQCAPTRAQMPVSRSAACAWLGA